MPPSLADKPVAPVTLFQDTNIALGTFNNNDNKRKQRDFGSAGYIFDDSKAIPYWVLAEYYGLSQTEKSLYIKIAEGIINFEMAIEVDSIPQNDMEKNNLSRICNIVYFTNPEVFYWNFNVRYAINGKPSEDGKYYLLPVYIIDGKELHADMKGRRNTLVFPSEDEVAAARTWVERGKANIHDKLESLPVHNGMTPFEMELTVYDWLCDVLTYDGSDIFKHEFNTIHGALVEGRVDCSGYSRTFQYIMCLLGVETLIYEGYSNDTPHAWNAIKLYGEWYQVDINVDGVFYKEDNLPWHCFFNRTDKFMADKGYKNGIEGSWYENPRVKCTATKYNYYIMTDTNINSDSDFKKKLTARINKAMVNGEGAFDIEFAETYAKPSDIYNKLTLIDHDSLTEVKFLYSPRGIVFGVMKKNSE